MKHAKRIVKRTALAALAGTVLLAVAAGAGIRIRQAGAARPAIPPAGAAADAGAGTALANTGAAQLDPELANLARYAMTVGVFVSDPEAAAGREPNGLRHTSSTGDPR